MFKWHGADENDKTRMIPGHRSFTQLAVIPDQFYYNVSMTCQSYANIPRIVILYNMDFLPSEYAVL